MTALVVKREDAGQPPSTKRKTATLLLLVFLSTISGTGAWTFPSLHTTVGSRSRSSRLLSQGVDNTDDAAASTAASTAASQWKEKTRALAFRTKAGFDATATDRQRMTYLIEQLAAYNPTAAPAASYYSTSDSSSSSNTPPTSPTLAGKWTLVYTDAPDILSLADGGGGPLGGKLEAIGQECAPPYIRNVIAWRRPAWASVVLGDDDDSDGRVLQKVVTQASATPDQPCRVNLVLKGLEFSADNTSEAEEEETRSTEKSSPWPNWLSQPLKLSGPASLPFGSFTIMYLDDELRIVRTNQGYYAMNERNTDATAWF
jgi:hypothetical protein